MPHLSHFDDNQSNEDLPSTSCTTKPSKIESSRHFQFLAKGQGRWKKIAFP